MNHKKVDNKPRNLNDQEIRICEALYEKFNSIKNIDKNCARYTETTISQTVELGTSLPAIGKLIGSYIRVENIFDGDKISIYLYEPGFDKTITVYKEWNYQIFMDMFNFVQYFKELINDEEYNLTLNLMDNILIHHKKNKFNVKE